MLIFMILRIIYVKFGQNRGLAAQKRGLETNIVSVGVPLVGTLHRCGVSTRHYPYKNYLCVPYLNSAPPYFLIINLASTPGV